MLAHKKESLKKMDLPSSLIEAFVHALIIFLNHLCQERIASCIAPKKCDQWFYVVVPIVRVRVKSHNQEQDREVLRMGDRVFTNSVVRIKGFARPAEAPFMIVPTRLASEIRMPGTKRYRISGCVL